MVTIRIWAVVAALAAGQAWAAEPNVYGAGNEQGDFQYDDAEEWREARVALPPYPRDGDLLEVPIGRDRYEFFIDTKHLTVGDDEVTRYSWVIRSSSGAENVFFEGIRCITNSYRAYGYGSSDGVFHPIEQSEWKPVRAADAFGYRYELARFYLCDPSRLPFTPERVIDRIKNADDETFSNGSDSIYY